MRIIYTPNIENVNKYFGYQFWWHRTGVNHTYSDFVTKWESDDKFRHSQILNFINMINSTTYYHNNNLQRALPDINKALFYNDINIVVRDGTILRNSYINNNT
jgi:hypothetical protein